MIEREIDIQITNKCNLVCPHCIYSSNVNGEHLPIEILEGLIPSLKKLSIKSVHLTGGEPLLHPDLFQFVSELKKNGIESRLQSNGLLIRKYLNDILQNDITDVLISIDGLEEYHDSFRNHKGLFSECIAAIQLLKANNINVRINSALCQQNISQMEELSVMLENLGVDYHSYFYLTPLGRGKQLAENIISPTQWIDFSEYVKSYPYTKKMKIKIQKAFIERSEKQNLCRVLKKNNIHITVTGDVFACVMLMGSNKSLGNIFKSDLDKIWLNNNQTWQEITEIIQQKNCNFNKKCNHGCVGMSLSLTNSFKNCDPRCEGGDIVPGCIRTYRIDLTEDNGDNDE
ncbi:MAG: radical SAM/SPASM domain-containing protein [Candidatus Heimdallarchaeaceae archaeon]